MTDFTAARKELQQLHSALQEADAEIIRAEAALAAARIDRDARMAALKAGVARHADRGMSRREIVAVIGFTPEWVRRATLGGHSTTAA